MHCIACKNEQANFVILVQQTRSQNGLINYSKINGITTMKKHVEVKHLNLVQKFVEEMNSIETCPLHT
jgi:hypothetical protein